MSENNFDIQSPPCVLCGRTDNCPEKYGEKRTYVEYNLTLHNYCLLMSSGIWQRGEEDEGIDGFLIEDIRKEVNRAARLVCNICRKKGASIGCVAPKCKRSYHFPCGLQKECVFQFMEDFRCAVCNNKDKFQKEMLRMGIHIPEKDASWELEDNAYQDLLQCYQHCDIRRCLCKNGRDYNKPDSKWEIKRCQSCGSRGTHLACSSIKSWEQNWDCVECRSIFAKGKYSKGKKHSLAPSEKMDGTACLLEEPSPKLPRQSPGSQHNRLLQSPKIMCQNHLSPCSLLELPTSNRVAMSLSPLMSNRNRSLRKKHLRVQRKEASNVLKELKHQINTKTTRLNINTENVWKSALKGFRQRNFRPTNTIEVKFTNCKNSIKADSFTGSKHLFFQLLMLHIQNSSLFEGSSAKNLSVDPQALKENLYFEAGKMIAVSLVHGGPSPGFFSKVLFDCLVYGPENVKPNLDDVADAGVAQTINKIKYSETLSSLQSTVHDCHDFLAAAGCLRPVTALHDKDMLVNDLLIHHVIKRITSPLESFRQGLKTLGVLEKMEMHPDAFSSLFCHKPENLSAEALCDLFTIHRSPDVNEIGGADFWMGYLQDVESGESVVTLQDILFFVTGCSSIPPIGFDPEPTIKFLPVHYPVGNRLLNCLELPITRTYENFKNKMEFTIRNTLRGERE
ncbi:G2/M phase-specific E3 ubiquitin-protein ligase isoform X2 [Lagopus muta]|uniref:G2/M phase-specific E3 ubiquitin-protein ligase isoform X2 n=1 Tax=Lagopus muta TaxID=64668 RepID=UPI00209E422C|nr:G2/M phase-specific E3 ubiquitin-protein ligase isoform X2 [Lagopus muta]